MISLYKVHNDNYGIWYTNGEKSDILNKLNKKGYCYNLPMPKDNIYKKNGLNWQSTVENLNLLLHWISIEDYNLLKEYGFKILKLIYPLNSPFINKLNDYETIVVMNEALHIEDITDVFDNFIKIKNY